MKSNKTGITGGAVTAELTRALEFTPSFLFMWLVLLDLQFSVWCFVDHCLSLWPFSSNIE